MQNPSEDGLRTLFQHFITLPLFGNAVLLDKYFNEMALQLVISINLGCMMRVLRHGGMDVSCEVPVGQPWGATNYVDIMLSPTTGTTHVILELKCVRVNAVMYPDADLQAQAETARAHQRSLADFFGLLSESGVRALQLHPALSRDYGGSRSVNQVLSRAAGQLRSYLAGLKRGALPPETYVGYVVALVGTRIVVERVHH